MLNISPIVSLPIWCQGIYWIAISTKLVLMQLRSLTESFNAEVAATQKLQTFILSDVQFCCLLQNETTKYKMTTLTERLGQISAPNIFEYFKEGSFLFKSKCSWVQTFHFWMFLTVHALVYYQNFQMLHMHMKSRHWQNAISVQVYFWNSFHSALVFGNDLEGRECQFLLYICISDAGKNDLYIKSILIIRHRT